MPIKVLHVIHSLSGGGAEKQAQLLACGLKAFGVESNFFCVDQHNHMMDSEDKIILCPRSSKYDASIFGHLNKAIECISPDVIHAWLPAAVTIPAMLVGRAKRIPVVFSYRNKMFFHRPISYFEFFVALFCSRKIISNNLIDQSNAAYRWLYKIKDGVTIHNAVCQPARYFRKAGDPKLIKLLYMGRLTPQKNILFLIDAVSKLHINVDWHLDVYGTGELEDQVTGKISHYGLNHKVTLKGFSKNPYETMMNYDLLVFPSLYEGMPNVLVEAFSVGLPVVASDIAASRDVVRHVDAVGWFDPKNVDSLVRLIGEFANNSQSFLSRARAALEYSKEFSEKNLAERYMVAYRSLLSN
jgi:glycosyltransferase involved in cell wall biosynthesis